VGKTYDAIDERLERFILAAPVFFVATAPSGDDGHVNVSPKGLDSLAVVGPRRVAYVDLTGSGAETIAHLRENGRIVLMFCAFAGPPKIVRLHGRGRVLEPGDGEFQAVAGHLPSYRWTRAIIDVEVTRVSDSCGYGVPLMRLEGERDQLLRWAGNRGEERLAAYRAEKNARSIDGLPALEPR
jgi:hypothetical protein